MSEYSNAYKLMKKEQAFTREKWQYETKMSNTAHQREVKDLVAAGLNPVLSSGGSGASYSATSDTSSTNSAASYMSSVMGYKATKYASDRSYAAAMAQAAATKAAAAAQVAAARIAADAQKYGVDYAKGGNPFGIADKYVTQFLNSSSGSKFKNLFTDGLKLGKTSGRAVLTAFITWMKQAAKATKDFHTPNHSW